jgi:hypothetical protein
MNRLAVPDEHAVDQAEQTTGRHGEQHRDAEAHLGTHQRLRGQHRTHHDRAADRDVDATRDDHDGHRHADQRDRGRRHQQRLDRAGGQERRGADRERGPQHHDHADQHELLPGDG